MPVLSTLPAASARLLAVGLAGLFWFTPASAVTEVKTAAQEATVPKFIAQKQDGKTTVGGLCVDIMRAIERVEPDLKFSGDQVWQPLVRAEAGVATGNLDAACAFLRNRTRESKFVYVDPPLFSVNYHLVARTGDDVQIANWDDVRKLGEQGVVLVINGFGMIKRLEELGGLRIDSGATDSKSNLDKLLAGRGRFYMHRSPGVKTEIRLAGVQDKVKLLPAVVHTEKFYMVMAKTVPAEVVEKMRKAISQLDRSGELAKLFEKWNGD